MARPPANEDSDVKAFLEDNGSPDSPSTAESETRRPSITDDVEEMDGDDISQKQSLPRASSRLSSKQSIPGNGTLYAWLSHHPRFEIATMSVIVSNAVWIGIDTEYNHANLRENGKLPLEPWSIVVENLFCFYFTFEVVVRFLSYKEKKECFFDAWFLFDSLLVACMILETWIMPIVQAIMQDDSGGGIGALSALRLLRLLRLARVGRLMRFVPELAKLVKGMVRAAKSVVFILFFLILVIYVFAIIFTGSLSDRKDYPLTSYCSVEIANGVNETDVSEGCLEDGEFGELGQDLFATMGDSFMSLFTRGVLGDNLAETVQAILDQSLILMWLFFIFLIITFATLLNMLIGVVCEVISEAAAEEEENECITGLTITIEDAFAAIDQNGDGLVCLEEWQSIKECKRVRKTLQKLGIEEERMEERLRQMEDMLFQEEEDEEAEKASDNDSVMKKQTTTTVEERHEKGLTVQQLIDRVVGIRPDHAASAMDFEILKAQVMKDQKIFKAKLKKIEDGVKKILGPGASVMDDGMPGMPGMPVLEAEAEEDDDELHLSDVPTQLLIQALQERQATQDRLAQQKIVAVHR